MEANVGTHDGIQRGSAASPAGNRGDDDEEVYVVESSGDEYEDADEGTSATHQGPESTETADQVGPCLITGRTEVQCLT